MEERYARNIPALTEDECAILHSKKVAVIGCGGLGGHLVELLSRIGVGCMTVVDGDVFEATNLNRQLLSEAATLGIGKAKAAAERISRINPDVEVRTEAVYLDANNAVDLIAGCDAVLDALDSVAPRKILAKACTAAEIPLIHGAIRGWVAQAAISMPGDGLMDILYPAETILRDKSVLSFTPALCASMQAALCVKLLTGRPVRTGTVYYFDLLHQEYEEIPLI